MSDAGDESEWESPAAYDALVGRWSAALAASFVAWAAPDLAGLTLDVGSGTGGVARAVTTAMAASGARGGRVLAVDLVRKYLRAGGHAALQADAARLPLRAGTVDAVLSGLALPQVDDAAATLREWARVARPGGVIAAYAWSDVAWLRAFWDEAGAPRAGPPAFDVAAAFRAAGLREVEARELRIEARFASFDEYWAPFASGEGPAPEALAALAPREQVALRERVRARVGERPAFSAAIKAAKARR